MKRWIANLMVLVFGGPLAICVLSLAWPGVVFMVVYAWLRDWDLDSIADQLFTFLMAVALTVVWIWFAGHWLDMRYGE